MIALLLLAIYLPKWLLSSFHIHACPLVGNGTAEEQSSDVKYEFTHDGKVFNNAYISARMDWYLKQNHYYAAYNTETETPSYLLLGLSAGTDVLIKGKKIAELTLIVDNLADVCYQDHLSRLKYADFNVATGRRGVFNMGRNFVFKLTVPIG